MSFWSDALEIGTEVGSVAAEGLEVAGEYTPLIGTAVNGAKAIYHSSKSHDAEMAGDKDKANFYGNEAAYDWMKAIPGVGTILGVGELAGGVANVVEGGKGGFVGGMNKMQDGMEDLGAMLGIDEFGASKYKGDPNAHDTFGSHGELREQIEEQEKFEEAAKRAGQTPE
jgi:hypothetical protein